MKIFNFQYEKLSGENLKYLSFTNIIGMETLKGPGESNDSSDVPCTRTHIKFQKILSI